jgi:hypothetical protein
VDTELGKFLRTVFLPVGLTNEALARTLVGEGRSESPHELVLDFTDAVVRTEVQLP